MPDIGRHDSQPLAASTESPRRLWRERLAYDRSDFPGLAQTLPCVALLGSRGTGMKALLEMLDDQSIPWIGFDKSISGTAGSANPFKRNQHSPWQSHLTGCPEVSLAVVSPAVPPTDSLLLALKNAGVPILTLPAAIDAVLQTHHQICVAGTHGKSSTSAMLSWILGHSQPQAPHSHFIGACFQHNGRSGQFAPSLSQSGLPPTAVIESCEFQKSFLHFSPSTVVLTGLERDHFDCFPDQSAEDDAFRTFLDQTPEHGTIVSAQTCLRSQELIRSLHRKTLTYEVCHSPAMSDADFTATDLRFQSSGVAFLLNHRSFNTPILVRLPLFGRHNVANAVAAIAAMWDRGVPVIDAVEALRSYPGLNRRFEDRGAFGGMALVDDYAHHPTAIRTTIRAARQRFPKRQIRIVMEPHQLVRLQRLQNEFVSSLALADSVRVLPVLPAREAASPSECHRASQKLVKQLRSTGTEAFFSPNLDHAVRTIHYSHSPDAVLLTMGAGRTHLIHDKLSDRLRQHSVA